MLHRAKNDILDEIAELIDLLASISVALDEMKMTAASEEISKALNSLYEFEESVVRLDQIQDLSVRKAGLERASENLLFLSQKLGLESLAEI